MKKLTKILAMVLALALTATMSVALTMAYLTDTDEDVNVMTLGNVDIEQIEQERGENGNLVDFTQAKPAYPAVGPIEWAAEGVNVNGTEYKVFTDDLKNVVDKIVTVKNTGKSDAFVRTIVVIEAPDYDSKNLIHVNVSPDGITQSSWAPVDINGIKYVYSVFTYHDALKPNEISAPSLVQVFLDSVTTNEDVAKFGSTWEIFALSQAVQTAGFANAGTALDTAFEPATKENVATWFSGMKVPVAVSNVDEARAAMKIPGVQIVLAENLVIDDDKGTGYCLYAKYDCQIDLNGYDIIVDLPGKEFYGLVYALNGAKVDIVGDGDITIKSGIGQFIWSTGANGDTEVNIYGGNWALNSLDFTYVGSNYCEGLYANRAGEVNIYGGVFSWKGFEKYTVNESREGVVTVYGGTFINFDPRVSHDSDGSYVAEGYKVVSQTQTNGDVWYTVVPE